MSYGPQTPAGMRRRVDPIRIWAGGAATMLVAGGVAFVGVLVIQAVFRVPGLHRIGAEVFGVDQISLAVSAGVAALLATALLHLLMVSTPRAHKFFAWIASLIVVALIVQELVGGDGWLAKLLLSALYLIIGVAITSLLTGVGRTAVKYVPYQPPPQHYADPEPPRYSNDDFYYRDDEPTRRFPRY